ncbi:GPP34 family phosphoprotein [Streptomyces anulatus]|uniref:GPP34 family phosphoprotein n=1 Tax=Streptomyces anulatus TaxID=1892 RepID=A0ABZ1ZPL2_STRAQ|nr:GPP34 family phosphoprotein [Streptomyces anulatus]WST84067.1 GPP34 family phosphoprotein [Streptomyces anulatus]WSU27920.1 GPP34 family phosphoprotein [Streptomyces anulatus]WSU93181.1 GPP34 family phosphoprotein [Streptomyces anulatus]WSW81854.1 GPP34 family phosphoprotein [Streptomyces anulatus]
MTTAKDLFIIAMDPVPDHAVGQGDLSLALAGAELLDLIGAGVITVDGDLIVPGGSSAPDDRLLGEAAARITGQPPYERIEDWLWRRGRDLAATYQDALEEDGELTQKRSGRLPFGPRRVELVDTPGRRRAIARREEGEPVLAALASAVGVDGAPSGDDEPRLDDGAVTTVVATVHEAVMELEAVRQRRTIENTAFANVWRGP